MKSKKTKSKSNITSNTNTSTDERDKERMLYDWSKMADLLRKSTCRSIERWYLSVGIPRSTFYDAVNREKCMKEAHEFALERIGCDREEYCWDEKLSSNSIIGLSLPQFLDRWQKDTVWRAELKKQEEEKNQNITVIMEPIKKNET